MRDHAAQDEGGRLIVVRHGKIAGRTRLRLLPTATSFDVRVAAQALARSADVRKVSPNYSLRSLLVEHDARLAAEAVAELALAALEGRSAAMGVETELGAPAAPGEAWHARLPGEVLEAFATRPEGLDEGEAGRRVAAFGPNVLIDPEGRSTAEIFASQFASVPVWLLMGSAAVSLATGGILDALVTAAVIALNAGIGFSTESWTERMIRQLSRPEEGVAPVWRGGRIVHVRERDVTLGDVLALSAGVSVAADARLIEADELALDESVLTGESYPARKSAGAFVDRLAPLPARATMAHRGAVVAGGRGKAVVTAIGADTEFGRVRELIGQARAPQAPMDRELDRLGVRLTIACLGAGALLMALMRARGAPLLFMLRSGVALAVSAIPEGLPAIAATSKAIAARQLAKRGVLVRNLSVLETSGAVDVLCLDKTGTLTQNRMAARVIQTVRARHAIDAETDAAFPPLGPDSTQLARVAILCNDAEVRLDGGVSGSGTEAALLALAKTAGLDLELLRAQAPRRDAWYRNKERSFMATEHDGEAGPRLAVKGAPEQVLALCSTALIGGEAKPLTTRLRADILRQNEAMAADGLRVLGFASSSHGALSDGTLRDLHWLGLVGLSDPLRPGAGALIASFQRAGIRTIILTGDQAPTARSLAAELGLATDGSLDVVDAATLRDLDGAGIAAMAGTSEVFARVSPEDKLRIVMALQEQGRVVAMTGDGVNDGPALRAANIGLALGRSGSQVAKDVADVVIANDGLHGIESFLSRGRTAEANVRRSVRFLLGTNFSETLLLLFEGLRGAGELETPLELLWLNLVTDVFPALGLALAPPTKDVLMQPPRDAAEPLFDRGEARDLALDAAIIAAPAMVAHLIGMARYGAGPQTRGMGFLTLTSGQLFHALTLTPNIDRARAEGPLSRWGVEGGVALSRILMIAPYAIAPLGRILGVGRPRPPDFLIALALGALPLLRLAPRVMLGSADQPRWRDAASASAVARSEEA